MQSTFLLDTPDGTSCRSVSALGISADATTTCNVYDPTFRASIERRGEIGRVVYSVFSPVFSRMLTPIKSFAGRLSRLAYWPASRVRLLSYFKYSVWLEAAQIADMGRVLTCVFQVGSKSAAEQRQRRLAAATQTKGYFAMWVLAQCKAGNPLAEAEDEGKALQHSTPLPSTAVGE